MAEVTQLEALRQAAAEVMDIDDVTAGDGQAYSLRLRGRLRIDSRDAFRQLTQRYAALGHTALFRQAESRHVVLAAPGVLRPPASPAWVNGVMLGLTVLSVLLTGASYGYTGPEPRTVWDWLAILPSGWPFLVSMLGILGAHELGHYFAARYHGVPVTLPYFIPLPFSPFGTMGAFIQLKAPPTDRRVLLDIVLAGPLAGLVIAVPVLIYGLITSAPLQHIPFDQAGNFEGNSILYVLIKFLVFGRLLPVPHAFTDLPPLLHMLRFYLTGQPTPAGGLDVFLNPVAWAGWAGLLVTGLNLIPAGQLDGGHALYVLFGERARRLLPVILVVLIGLGFFWTGWFIWAALIYFLVGRRFAEPLDQITELDPARKLLAAGALVLFGLLFTPVPLT